jgi:hypothetical protein
MKCNYCDAGKYLSYKGSKGPLECVPCSEGTFSTLQGATSGESCDVCRAGQFSWQGAVECLKCAPGSYQSGLGMYDCTLCAEGKYSTVTSAVLFSECRDCNFGSFSLSGQSSCLNCSVGSYQARSGASECVFCSAGKYSDVIGTLECKQCSAGSYSKLNVSACTTCQSGKFSTALGHSGSCTTWTKCKVFNFSLKWKTIARRQVQNLIECAYNISLIHQKL